MPGSPVARTWLVSRIDRRCSQAITELLTELAEDVSLATADAVTIRRLSPDGSQMTPVAAYHPDPQIRAAMTEIMEQTTETTGSGLWRPVVCERQVARWHVPKDVLPAEASPEQADYLRRYPVRAVMGAPAISQGGQVVGGVSLVRYVIDRPFIDDDEALLVDVARRVALALEFQQTVLRLGSRPPLADDGEL